LETISRPVALAEAPSAATATAEANARLSTCSNTLGIYQHLHNGLKAPEPSAAAQQQRIQAPPAALQEGTHFAVLASDGSSSKLAAVSAAMRQADVVLLGEFHDDSVAHALQLALLKHVATRLGYTLPPARPTPAGRPTAPPAQHQHHQQQQPRPGQHIHQQGVGQQQQQPSPRPLILSLEMFETDVQPVLSEYLSGLIPLSDLLKDGRPWSNYMHDYHHLVEVCKQLQLPVVAANAPRRYVSLAGRAGSPALLQLPPAARQYLPPLPHAPSSEAYTKKVQQNMQRAKAGMDAVRTDDVEGAAAAAAAVKHSQQQDSPQQQQQQEVQSPSSRVCPHIGLTVSSNFLAAQSLWDATMAHSIARALQQQQQQQQQQHSWGPSLLSAAVPAAAAAVAVASAEAGTEAAAHHSSEGGRQGPLVVHVCGKFHCEHGLGIPEHLAAYAPDARVLVVVFTPSDKLSVTAEEAAAAGLVGAADFVVLTDAKLPRSFDVEHPV
jgi:uncharacterized iron-regulated protein